MAKAAKNTKKADTIDLSTMVYGKVPPQARELEEVVIGAVLNEKDAYYRIVETLHPEAFYVEAHQLIYRAFVSLAKKYEPIDIFTVIEELKAAGNLDLVGGAYALTSLSTKISTSANIEHHARIIKQKFIQREVIKICGQAVSDGYDDATEVEDLIEEVTAKLYDLSLGIYQKDFLDPETNAMNALAEINTKMEREPGTMTGKPSGFKGLDKITNGWQDTDLIILAARPAVGKTALALNFARKLAEAQNVKLNGVGFFSLEMSTNQLVQRIISAISEVPLEKIRRADLNTIEYDIVKTAIANFSGIPIFIDDTAGLTTIELRAKARRLKARHKVGLIIIDYLQLMSDVEYNKMKSKNDQVGAISRDLKVIAKDLELPIIALSQLSRAVETRTETVKVPNLSDLRDSGAIEQDADMVMFLYLDGGVPRVKIAKHRNGTLDTITLNKDLSIQKFYDSEAEPWRPAQHVRQVANTGNFDDGIAEVDEYNFSQPKK